MSITALRQRVQRTVRKNRRPSLPVGNDGLTDAERLESLLDFRRGVGAKPAPTAEHKEWSAAVADKLSGTAAWTRPPRRG